MARRNPYADSPLCVAEVDPATGRHTRSFIFLGAAPRAVLEAARRAAPSKGDPRVPAWGSSDAATLAAHYGQGWRAKLAGADPPASQHALQSKRAGGDFSAFGGDFSAFGDLSELDREAAPEASAAVPPEFATAYEPEPPRGAVAPRGPAAALPVYSDIAVYPEDTLFDLRMKLCAASGVPLWRAHLFYYVGAGGAADDEGPLLPYRITLDNVPLPIDWRAIADRAQGQSIAGLAIDPLIEDRRDALHVEALDSFTQLAPLTADGSALTLVRVTRAYFVDMATVLEPVWSSGSGPHRGKLAAALRDRYQFDLLYYGGVLRYWPHLSADAASRALGAERDALAAAYPRLAPDPAALRARFATERAICERALDWQPPAARGGRNDVAVTLATMRVLPAGARLRTAVRNIFDWVPTAPDGAVAARVQFDMQARGVQAVKRHISSYTGSVAPAASAFVARATRHDTAVFALSRARGGVEAPPAVAPIAVLTIGGAGNYEVSAEWREEDRTGFDALRSELMRVAEPTLRAVNAMGAAAFPVGGALQIVSGAPSELRARTRLGSITASAFWPHAVSTAAYRDLKARLREYELAGIITVRGLQQSGTYAFIFRRGIVAYDRQIAERVITGDHPVANGNQYAWLFDNDVAARWAAAFAGRMVRLYHRATDLRVEIVRADSLGEFDLIRRYIFAFLESLRVGRNAIALTSPGDGAGSGHAKRLRRLQERDPALFDLKRHASAFGPEPSVYSVLCQAGRQPHIYNKDEFAGLGAKARARLIEYWNFTEAAPAYYDCPSASYPHLSFRAGVHPLGYCLPCCKKARAAVNSRAAAVNQECIDKFARAGAGARGEVASSAAEGARHILAYGKALPAGRLGDLPRPVSEELLLDAVPGQTHLVLVGVPQAVPAVPAAGFAFALARALAGRARAPDPAAVLSELADGIRALGAEHQALGPAAAEFSSGPDLAAALERAFVAQDPAPCAFSPGGALAERWPDLLIAAARVVFGVETVVLFDAAGNGLVTLEATQAGALALADPRARAAGAPPIIILLAASTGVAPVALTARSRRGQDPTVTVFEPGSSIYAAFAAAFAANAAADKLVTAATVAEFAAADPDWAVDARLATVTGAVYAVMLRAARGPHAGALAYIPVAHGPVIADGTRVVYGPRPAAALPAAALDAAVAAINAFASRRPGVEPLPARADAAVAPLVAGGSTVGYRGRDRPPYLYFYHDGAGGPAAGNGARAIQLPYSPRDVDAAIARLRYGTETPEDAAAFAAVEARAARAHAQQRVYPLLLAEFAATLRAERNTGLRDAIKHTIASTQFTSSRSIADLRARLGELLSGWPDDGLAVRAALSRAYAGAAGGDSRATIAESANRIIDATVFTFDRLTLARLRALKTHAETVTELRRIMAPHVAAAGTGLAAAPINMFIACAEQTDLPRSQCEAGRLAIADRDLAGFFDCLARDVHNAGKATLLSAASAGVLDGLDFIRRPDEHITILQS